MATTQGSFTRIYDGLRHGPLPLQFYKTTVTIPTGATEISVTPSNEVSGAVVAVWLDPGTLSAGATIKGYAQNDGLATLGPDYFLDYTVPNPAAETRYALKKRVRVHGRIQIDVASAVAADSFTLYVWVDPNADTALGTAGTPSADVLTVQGVSGGTTLPVTATAGNTLVPVEATIAESGSLSSEVDLGAGRVLCGIDMPADWDAANLTFQASYNTGGTFDNLYDQYGTEKNIAAAEDRYIALDDPAFWLGVRYLKVRSGTAASAVAQTAARTIYLITKPV